MNQQHRPAPYEKHLERWIADNPHRFGYKSYLGEWCGMIDRLVARQYPLLSGRPDLLAWNRVLWGNMAVIELKQGDIDSKALAQVLRYMSELRSIAYHTLYTPEALAEFNYAIRDQLDNQIVWGILVGSSIKDDNILAACEACHIIVMLYDYDRDHNLYTFERVDDLGVSRGEAVYERQHLTADLAGEFMELYRARIQKEGFLR